MELIESLKPYVLKFEKALVPMARGSRSSRVLQIAFDISGIHGTEITAFTVREEKKKQFWTDNVNTVTDSYSRGKLSGVKVIPKIVSASSTREAIVRESETHSYDLLILATSRRSVLSGALFGNIGDYVFKNVHSPIVLVSLSDGVYPYRSIIAPLSEDLSTRHSISFALQLKRALQCPLVIPDLRKYDSKKPTHGFRILLSNMQSLEGEFGEDITFVRSGYRNGLLEEITRLGRESESDAVVIGVRPKYSGTVRISSIVKNVVKQFPGDVIVVKKA